MIASVSALETGIGFGVGFIAALAGAIAYEPLKQTLGALRAKKPPLSRWYWQVTYRSGDKSFDQLWSIELVQVFSRGKRIWGTMYRVYPNRYERRWDFEGRVQGERHLSLVYHSVGEDYGSNGTISLGALGRWLWCGAFQQIPEVERGVQLQGQPPERRQTRRVGPDFTEESLIEWIAADREVDDPVRAFLASIPASSPAGPSEAAKYLPPGPCRVLMEFPPFTSSIIRGFQFAASPVSLTPIYAEEQLRHERHISPKPWESPSRKVLGLGGRGKQAV